MTDWKLDLWLTSERRVWIASALGTLACILIAFAIDSFSLTEGRWSWGSDPWKNALIPGVIAPPAFYFLLTKMRQLSIARHRLERVASTDSLTSVLNRAAFSTLVEAYLDRFAGTSNGTGAMLVIDVDHFKKVNDTVGHQSGDEVLKSIALAIKGSLRQVDLIGRLGGEEFSVFLPGAPATQTSEIAERIRKAVESIDFRPNNERWPLSVSIGGATFCASSTFSELYREADRRLYHAKQSGRNAIIIRPVSDPSYQALQ